MASESTFKELSIRRSNIKGRVTKFKTYLESLLTFESISNLEISKLAKKLSRVEALFTEFDGLQSQLEVLKEANQEVELTTRDLMEQEFDNCISIAQDFMESHSSSPKLDEGNTSSCAHSNSCHHHHDQDACGSLGFKLPTITIPKFDGTYNKWLEFKEVYSTLIHDNSRVQNIHKFHYLSSYLEGEAARVLSNLEVSDKNYHEAWSLLCNRFDNKRQLINNHLKSLFSIESVRETDKSLRFIIDHVSKNLRALSTLGLPTDKWDVLIIHILAAKLDNSTVFKWEEHRNNLTELPTLNDLFVFLKNRADVLETVNRSKTDRQTSAGSIPVNNKPTSNSSHQNKTQVKTMVATSKGTTSSSPRNSECAVCSGKHRVYECTTFKSQTPEDRNSTVASLNLCTNCLRSGHTSQACKLPGSCRSCKQRHNSLLHLTDVVSSDSSPPKSVVMSTLSTSDVLLCTAKVRLTNPKTNETVCVRALLDSGSQSSFITEGVKLRLNLTPQPSNVSIVAIGNNTLNLNPERCALKLQSISTSFEVTMSCLVLKTITDDLPRLPFNINSLKLSDYVLADPSFNEPSPIDMLIGSDLFWDLIGSKQQSLGSNNPNLRSSKLGWLIAGPTPNQTQVPPKRSLACNFLIKNENQVDIQRELTTFWELETIPIAQPISEEQKMCEKFYLSTSEREGDGRFSVGIPLKEGVECLGESYFIAKKRFQNLESRFSKNPELKRMYSDFIEEYSDLGHLSESTEPKPPNSYFLPHHPVIREKSESTKLRVVFNASEPTTSGFSVNDLQMIGPTIQDSLFNILLRFRQYRYVVTGDIEKMYRQVNVRESDRNLQLILWRDNEAETLRTLRLNTITYGFASSSFLSTRCIWQIGEECNDSKIKTIIQNDFYCDDLLTGANTAEELRYIQRTVSNELAKGCFPLRKYRSNLPNLLSNSESSEDSSLIISNAASTLGIGWSPQYDYINFPLDYSTNTKTTKRNILSSTFKIFDPLGLLSLCTISAKILLQKIWAEKIDWDEPVPHSIQDSWQKFSEQIGTLSSLKIQRQVLANNAVDVELHCFCDASQLAYGSCIYLRSVDKDGQVHVNLLCAKARVAPIKACSIPRLELCSTLLGAELSTAVKGALRIELKRSVFWTDSSVVLGWLKSPHKTKTFVANRVAAIGELTDSHTWRHVPTSQNPADLASRGVEPKEVNNLTLWWHGPSLLKLPESSWPILSIDRNMDLPELKAMPALVAEDVPMVPDFNLQKFSKLSILQRVLARVYRFIHNCKNPTNKLTGTLQVHELNKSITVLTKIAQNESFSKEIASLKSKKSLKTNTHLCSLNPFLDDAGVLRVGGRIDTSSYPYEKRHPIVLKSNHHLTKLIFQAEHAKLLHAGPQHILASVRERYWPIGGRRLARDVVRHCLVCRRFKGETMTNIMGGLPADRVEPDFPFSTVGTDFAGPFLITDRKGRGCKITKCYLCIFVCFRYKCLHLEVVSELTKDAFILTLKRFISRRGMPKTIYCDNGRNFVAAAKELGNFLQTNCDSICDFAASRGIEFRFSPVYAPHFNGLAEAGVKSAKHHLYRTLGQSHLTFEELTSVFTQIEAILNSRPLCPLSPSPNDFQSLTPAHFLIGRQMMAIPSSNYLDRATHRLNRFQRLEQVKQHFWRRWSSEYIAELQQRNKWRVKSRDLTTDDLVLIKEAQTPPLCWRLGRVNRLYSGPDHAPRVADITTANGTVRRAINRLVLLPTSEENEA